MKKSIVWAILGIAAASATTAYGQGQVFFMNYFSSTSPTINFSPYGWVFPASKRGLACIFHKGIEQRSGGSIIMVEITRPNESADHRFFGDRL